MVRLTYTAVQVRARDLRADDVILVVPGEDSFDAPLWRDVMDVWRDGDMDVAEKKYTYPDGIRDDEKIEFIREHLSGQFGSYVLVRYHIEKPGATECESELIAFRACDLVTVQQAENPPRLDAIDPHDSDALHETVASLPPMVRQALDNALTAVATSEYEDSIVRVARQVVADHYPDRVIIGVMFTATNHDGVYYVNDSGTVIFDDATTAAVDFGPHMTELLSMRYGKTSRGFVVAVHLLDGDIAAADHGEGFTIQRFFEPPPSSDH